jgi:hypothetical protein
LLLTGHTRATQKCVSSGAENNFSTALAICRSDRDNCYVRACAGWFLKEDQNAPSLARNTPVDATSNTLDARGRGRSCGADDHGTDAHRVIGERGGVIHGRIVERRIHRGPAAERRRIARVEVIFADHAGQGFEPDGGFARE